MDSKEEAKQALDRSRELLESRQWSVALEILDEAIHLNAEYAEAWQEKGKLLHRLGRVEEALEAFEKVIAIVPEDTDGWYNKGICLTKLGKNAESLQAFYEAKRLNAEDVDGAGLNGIDFMGILGRGQDALETLPDISYRQEGIYINERFHYRVDLSFKWDDGVLESMWVAEDDSERIVINSPRYAQCSLAIEARERITCNYPAKELAADLASELASAEDAVRFYVFPNGQLPAYTVRTAPKYAREIWRDIVATDRFVYYLKRTIGFDKEIGRRFAEKVIGNFAPF